jgi:hypothetical protein
MTSTKRGPQNLRPRCRGIEPDSDRGGYYCTSCGYDLIETKTGWYRHGVEWRHPEVWR